MSTNFFPAPDSHQGTRTVAEHLAWVFAAEGMSAANWKVNDKAEQTMHYYGAAYGIMCIDDSNIIAGAAVSYAIAADYLARGKHFEAIEWLHKAEKELVA